jgi:serine/threonine-protein kinase
VPAPQLTPGSIFAADFRIVKPLSEGGMGAVYVVEQISTGKPRALKLMLPNLVADVKLRQRFEQEARVGARIKSEHVVEVVGAGVDAATGMPWLAMELLQGEDLAEYVRRNGPVPLDEVWRILEELCHAIGAAHEAGVVHRDLKPENVFLAKANRAGVQSMVKVLDFGIAKLAAEAKTTATEAIGSPMWMAPEQTARGGAIGPQTDVWAIGLIAFHLLTGRLFWRSAEDEGGTLANLIREIVLDPVPSASERAAEVSAGDKIPAGFGEWFARAVERDPRLRFGNANDALSAFEHACGRGPTRISPRAAHDEAPPRLASTLEDRPHAALPGRQVDPVHGTSASVPDRWSSRTDRVGAAPPKRGLRVVILASLGVLALGLVVAGWTMFHARGPLGSTEATASSSAVLSGSPLRAVDGEPVASEAARLPPAILNLEPKTPSTDPSGRVRPVTVGGSPKAHNDASAAQHEMPRLDDHPPVDPQDSAAPTTTASPPPPSSPPPPEAAVLADPGEGLLRAAGLVWEKHPPNLGMTWRDAAGYCAQLALGGGRGWKLPTSDQLVSLHDSGSARRPGSYWSSSPAPSGFGQMWYVNFIDGTTSFDLPGTKYMVRCVR